MSVEIRVEYLGDLHTRAVHGPSGDAILTDAPVDNEGKGEHFSPTDLLATSMATCVVTIMGILARRRGIDMSGVHASVSKEMIADPKRRCKRLALTIWMPAGLSADERTALENAAHGCPVHASLDPRVEAPIEFVYPDVA
jgi:putative redox protein